MVVGVKELGVQEKKKKNVIIFISMNFKHDLFKKKKNPYNDFDFCSR